VLASVSISRISFQRLTKFKFNVPSPEGVIFAVPVQLEFSVYVPVIGDVTIAPFTSKVPAPVTFPLPSRIT
jgi:hypothetical protein